MNIDLAAIVRRRKPDQRRQTLRTRARDDLVSVETFAGTGGRAALVPDTTVYIHQAAGRLNPATRALLEGSLMSHCSVCLAELSVGLGARAPTTPGWLAARAHFEELFDRIPDTRLITPDASTWADAGMVAGTLARLQTFQPHQRKECLNDALIYLTAARAGLPVLTANRDEFDLIQQLAPEGRFIFYDAA